MNLKINAVTAGCRQAASALEKFPWLAEFYLAGGTALALIYGHRISVDLDFFSFRNRLEFSERRRPLQDLRSLKATIEEERDGTIHARMKGTHLSLLRYEYPLLRPLQRWGAVKMAHPVDIGLMKLGAIVGRGSRKDFIDLYVIAHRHISLTSLMRLAPRKFVDARDFRLQVLRALVYFADADEEREPRALQPFSWPVVKKFFEREVRNLSKKLL